jgi:hypothetical protein
MTLASGLRSVGVFFSIFIVSIITKRVVWLLESRFGINLIAGWISFSVLYAFVPTFTGGPYPAWLPILAFITVSVAYYFWQYFNAHEIELVSTLLKSTSTSMRVEEISGSLKVKADCGVAPHAYGVLSAWLFYGFLSLPVFSQYFFTGSPVFILILVTLYLLVSMTVIVQIVNRRFSFEMWQRDLNERRQMIKDVHNRDELEDKLTRIRQLLVRREVAFQVLIILSAIYLLSGTVLPNTSFPFSLALVFTAFLFAVSSRSFALQLYKLLYNRTPMSIEVLDLSKAEEETAKRSTWKQVKRAAKIIFAILIAVYGFLEIVSNTYEIWQKLKIFR